jgi:hypothetical protein
MASMDWDDYLRHEAAMHRQLAEKIENVFGKQELLDLAVVCEEVANSIEDRTIFIFFCASFRERLQQQSLQASCLP